MKEVLSGIEYIYVYHPVGDTRVAKNSMIEVLFDKISGNFATAGPIYVYQYEYEEEITELTSGSMGQEGNSLNNSALTILPNPFTEKVEIKYYLPKESPRVTLKIYDITGRLIKKLYDGPAINDLSIIWRGRDESERIVANGVYFLQLQECLVPYWRWEK